MATPMLSCSRRYLSAVNAPLTAPTYPALAKPAPPSGEFLHQPLDVIGRAISAANADPLEADGAAAGANRNGPGLQFAGFSDHR
jgi:hypothetical protein